MVSNSKRTWNKMNCLVTGGAGFIGSNLVDKLIELGHKVICIDNESAECHEQFYWNPKANNYRYDICDYEKIAHLFNGIDYVFHIASDARIQPAILNPRKSIESNAVGTANVIELSRINKVKRFIYSSTSSAYGKKAILPNIETQPSDPLTPYSAAKVFGENLARVYYNLYGLETVSLRYFNVYGDRQPLKGQYAPVIGLFLKQHEEGKPLTVVGDGSQRRDFTHISDVIQANILASEIKDGFGEVYNIGYGNNYSILDIANMISNDVKFIPSRIGEVQETLASNQKFKDLTGWMPKVSLIEWLSK
jgi:UDP-glucose 4-epimerase